MIQGLAKSIAVRKLQAHKSDKPATNAVESFCQYVAQTMNEHDPEVQHLTQHKISQILFQAQSGSLALENPLRSMAPIPPQSQFFQPENTQYSLTGINNQAVSTYCQFNVQQQRSLPQNVATSMLLWPCRDCKISKVITAQKMDTQALIQLVYCN